jgi:hypothetical protein
MTTSLLDVRWNKFRFVVQIKNKKSLWVVVACDICGVCTGLGRDDKHRRRKFPSKTLLHNV